MESILKKRTDQIKKEYNNLVALEDIYCKLGYDFAIITDEFIESMKSSRTRKTKLKELNLKSMAEYEREYELSDEYLFLKAGKYTLRALEQLKGGLKVRIESLRAESHGTY